MKTSRSHVARKELFQRGIQRGSLSVREIEEALPPGSLSDAERWLLYYSLLASGVAILDGDGLPLRPSQIPPAPSE